MAISDRYGFSHATGSHEAVAAFETAVHGVAAHRATGGEALARALAADPLLVAGHALKGLANVILGRAECLPAARLAFADAIEAGRVRGGLTGAEQALQAALGAAVDGRFAVAADRLDGYLDRDPLSFLHAKLSHALRFMAGDGLGMLRGTARVLDAWSPGRPGYGYLLGCHAFALEEHGLFDAAERIGRRAVAEEPDDSWGLHAVGHVYEMQGRTADGIAWLEERRPTWSACNNFSFHMAWHLALFHLERGDHDRVLELYDAEVRPAQTDDFRDVANAASLLWRLRQDGVAVGRRWSELGAVAAGRQGDMTLVFACLHNLLTLVASGELAAARAVVAGMEGRTAQPGRTRMLWSDQTDVMDGVGCALARLVLSMADPQASRPAIEAGVLARRLQRIGGSNAQRDVFMRTLAEAAAQAGDAQALADVLAIRRRYKADDTFVVQVQALLAAGAAHQRLSA